MPDYTQDKIRAVDAKFEAQKIAFAPLTFQAVRALLELGILQKISDAGDAGLTREEAAEQTGLSLYGVGVLAEIALGMNVLKLRPGDTSATADEERFVLGKTGWFLLEDDMTRVNFNFTNDICYQGAYDLAESVRSGKPRGLPVFGEKWNTIYEALSSLPEQAKKSWFEFDHFYSDIAFPEAFPIVFADPPRRLFDIGGNTAKWAIRCCTHDPQVQVTIIDLPGQTAAAEKNAVAAGFGDRIDLFPCNVLDTVAKFPEGADAVWMSQFLDCFSLEQVTAILTKIHASAKPATDIWVLEPLWDMQRYEAAAYSLQATSLYFTCMANGNSKMYRFAELTGAIEKAGFELSCAHHGLGSNSYSLLRFRKRV
ncbi:O-methyltransferase [Spirochaetia bacterium]|nr:O-methyltransferase [Spirochaetia bacterium]